MLKKYTGKLIWMFSMTSSRKPFYDFISKQLHNTVYFFPNCRIKIKIAKCFAYFQNLKNIIFTLLLQIFIHFFDHLFIMKV